MAMALRAVKAAVAAMSGDWMVRGNSGRLRIQPGLVLPSVFLGAVQVQSTLALGGLRRVSFPKALSRDRRGQADPGGAGTRRAGARFPYGERPQAYN
ncbi:MAG: hypothetical protein ACK40I_11275 [Tabrizicola sp.]